MDEACRLRGLGPVTRTPLNFKLGLTKTRYYTLLFNHNFPRFERAIVLAKLG